MKIIAWGESVALCEKEPDLQNKGLSGSWTLQIIEMDLEFHIHSSDSAYLLFEAWIPAILIWHPEELKEQPVVV